LPATPDDRAVHELDRALGEQLVRALGRGFCLLEAADDCNKETGGELRVSEIYARGPDLARVVVACRMVWPGHLTTDNGKQEFILARIEDRWRIVDRHGAGP
jgi:hypothetical protein